MEPLRFPWCQGGERTPHPQVQISGPDQSREAEHRISPRESQQRRASCAVQHRGRYPIEENVADFCGSKTNSSQYLRPGILVIAIDDDSLDPLPLQETAKLVY